MEEEERRILPVEIRLPLLNPIVPTHLFSVPLRQAIGLTREEFLDRILNPYYLSDFHSATADIKPMLKQAYFASTNTGWMMQKCFLL
jgi:hypothetical protein